MVLDDTQEVREHLRQTAFHDRVDAIMQRPKDKKSKKKLTGPPKSTEPPKVLCRYNVDVVTCALDSPRPP